MKLTIDRFEGSFAVIELENSEMVNVPRVIIPADAKEGSVLVIEVDAKETEVRLSRAAELMKKVWLD
jgi:hypothetical protein